MEWVINGAADSILDWIIYPDPPKGNRPKGSRTSTSIIYRNKRLGILLNS